MKKLPELSEWHDETHIALAPANRRHVWLAAGFSLSALALLLLGKQLFVSTQSIQPVAAGPSPYQTVQMDVLPPTESESGEVTVAKAPDRKFMPLNQLTKRRYTYTFEGVATYKHRPAPNAGILVRVNAGNETKTVGGVTNDDGSYSISVPVLTALNTPVDWTIEAFTPEFEKVELVGRRITTEEDKEDSTVTLQGPLAFLSK